MQFEYLESRNLMTGTTTLVDPVLFPGVEIGGFHFTELRNIGDVVGVDNPVPDGHNDLLAWHSDEIGRSTYHVIPGGTLLGSSASLKPFFVAADNLGAPNPDNWPMLEDLPYRIRFADGRPIDVNGDDIPDTIRNSSLEEIYNPAVIEYGAPDEKGEVDVCGDDHIAGDTNSDGMVNFQDFLVLARNFGRDTDAAFADGDFNCDGSVDFQDLWKLALNFGTSL